jgi:hypothetical protein
MTRRQSYFAYVALLVGVIAFASSFARPTSGQLGNLPSTSEGRYRLATTATGNVAHVYLTDSVTGRTWAYSGDRDWVDMGSPVRPK